jgi:hypothetical protein
MFLAGCASPAQTATTEPSPTVATLQASATPDPCTGWQCTITGVVYEGTAKSGNEMRGVVVSLSQSSYCSPSRGDQEIIIDDDGVFEFEVFLHDTDGFQIEVELDGYEPANYSFGGFDCLYCSCPPVEIVLQPVD